jgi:uncharacterized protein YbaR (Trm112 family)
MHISFAEYFCDPVTGADLKLEIEAREGDNVREGVFVSPTAKFPIVNGVPRFVSQEANYAESFAWQWKRWPKVQFDSENIGKPMEGTRGGCGRE